MGRSNRYREEVRLAEHVEHVAPSNQRILTKTRKHVNTSKSFTAPSTHLTVPARLSFRSDDVLVRGVENRGISSLTFPAPQNRLHQKVLLASSRFGEEENASILSGISASFSFAESASASPNLNHPHIDWQRLRIHMPGSAEPSDLSRE
jgi:hypothetical protein